MTTALKTVKSTLTKLIPELFIIFCLIFTINNYIGNVDKTIKADAVGYYEYLPSLFIYNDLNRKAVPYKKGHPKYERLETFQHTFYNEYEEYLVNKYPCGTALLQSPFFLWEYLTSDKPKTGYEYEFHRSVFYATIFYLFLGLVFFRKTLLLYGINRWVIFFCQLLVVFATPVAHFANFDAGFSHNYSFFAISMFAFYSRSFFIRQHAKHLLLASLSLGLIFLLRNPNLMVLAALPLLAGSWPNLKLGFQKLWSNKKLLIAGVILFVLVAFIQLFLWYLQTGSFFIYSYQGEGFNFLDPHILDVLFSYQKGLFVYTPVLFISVLAAIWMFIKGERFLGLSWLGFFLVITYIFSSWWAWHYGASFGMRVYVDFLLILFLPLALLLSKAQTHKALKAVVIIISSICIPVNIIQTYQYKEYILHWNQMDRKGYWRVFLKTDPVYRGILWRKEVDRSKYHVGDSLSLSSHWMKPQLDSLILSDTLEDAKLGAIRLAQEQDFDIDNNAKILVYVSQDDSLIGYLDTYLLHFEKEGFNKHHRGYYDMILNEKTDSGPVIIKIFIRNENESRQFFDKMTLHYLEKKD